MLNQKKVNEIKENNSGNDLKQELTSVLYPKAVVRQDYCELWSQKSTSGGMGRKAGTCYLKNGKIVSKPKDKKNVIDFKMIPELRKELKELGIEL